MKTREEEKLGKEADSAEAKPPLHLTGSSSLLMALERQGARLSHQSLAEAYPQRERTASQIVPSQVAPFG